MYRLDTTTRFLKGPTVNYFDIDGLLASEEALEVRFLEETQELGWLEKNGSLEPNDPVCASKPTPDFKMPAGGEAKLPLWLVKLWEQEQLIEVTKGPYEADTVRGALEVNPLVFSMAQHPYFYEIDRDSQPGAPLSGLISSTFKKRFERIYDQCENWREADYTNTTNELDSSERNRMLNSDLLLKASVFIIGYKARKDFERWKKRESHRIQASSFVPKQHS